MQSMTLAVERPRALVRSARPRRLGSLFVPTRRVYVLVLPSVLLAGALACWAYESDFSMVVAASLITLVSAYILFDLLGRRGPLRVTHTLAATLGLAYGLGTVNTWLTLPRGDDTLGAFLQIDTVDLSHTMASCCVALALLLGIGELLEKAVFGEEFQIKFDNRMVLVVTVGALALLGSFARGSTGFMGASVQDEGASAGHVGLLASLAQWLTGSLLAVAVCMSLNIKGVFLRNYTRVLSVLLFLLVFPLGRRLMIYSVVLTLMGLRLGRYRVPYSPLKKIVLLGVLGGMVYAASIGFFYLRIAGYSMVKPTLVERIGGALELARTKSYAEIKEQISANVEKRTFVLGFLAQLEGYSATMPTAHGEDIASQLALAVPSALNGDKDLFFTEEQLANTLYGSDYQDEANSVLTAGAVDFGMWGIFLYPLIAALIIRLFFEAIGETIPIFASCFIIIASFATILEPETDVTAYFIMMRNGLLFGAGIWALMALPEFRVKNVGV